MRRSHIKRHGTDNQHPALLYYSLIKTTYPNVRSSLCNQLGASIYIRGQSLLYLKVHSQKLAFERHDQNRVQDAADKSPALKGTGQGSDHCMNCQSVDQVPLALVSGIVQSGFDHSMFSRIAKDNKPLESSVNDDWAMSDDREDSFYYPLKPEKTNDHRYLSCTLCGNLLEESGLTPEAWEYVVKFSVAYEYCEK